jgi:hypothetical protein
VLHVFLSVLINRQLVVDEGVVGVSGSLVGSELSLGGSGLIFDLSLVHSNLQLLGLSLKIGNDSFLFN